ncbi:MAG: hypothetical protein ACLFQV_13170 [Vulcanimicrobiota bacterium]
MNKIRFMVLMCLGLLLAGQVFAQYEDYVRPEVENQGEIFMHNLGKADYFQAYKQLDEHSKQTIIQITIDRFQDLDNRLYTRDEMDYLLRTNVNGHRTVIFEDLLFGWCDHLGIKPESLKNATAVTAKKHDPHKVTLEITAGSKKFDLVMKKEAGMWKAAWYPGKYMRLPEL